MSDFDKWCELKKKIDKKDKIIGIKTRDIVFVSIGKNIGVEVDGKGDNFLRPFIVLNAFKNNFLGLALTKKQKSGKYYFSFSYKEGIISTAVLTSIRQIDTKRVLYKSGMIKKDDFEKLIGRLLEVITPSHDGEPRRELVKILYQEKSIMSNVFVHKSSYIDDNVQIGENTKIWHFCHILSNTVIGKNCSFGQNCVVGPKVKIGNGVKVQNNVSIYEGIEIEDDVFLGPSCVFTNVINPRAFIQRKHEFKKTLLKKGCTIGANATIVCGVTIGEYALIGAGAVVNKDVKPYALMVGVPARQIGWVGISGNTLKFDKNGVAIDSDGRKYTIIDGKLKEL